MVEKADYSAVYDFLYRIDRRISSLEKDADFIGMNIEKIDGEFNEKFSSLRTEMETIRASLKNIKKTFSESSSKMAELSKDLKSSVKKDDVIALQSTVDELQFEEYATKRDIVREQDNA